MDSVQAEPCDQGEGAGTDEEDGQDTGETEVVVVILSFDCILLFRGVCFPSGGLHHFSRASCGQAGPCFLMHHRHLQDSRSTTMSYVSAQNALDKTGPSFYL